MKKLGQSILEHPGAYVAGAIGIAAVYFIARYLMPSGTVELSEPYEAVPTTGSQFDIPGAVLRGSDVDLFQSHTDTLDMMQGAIDRWEDTKKRFGWE